jgi:hypothetical protein
MMSPSLFLLMRVLHVLLAAVWLGSAAFITFIMMPAVNAAGPSGGQVMLALNRKGMVAFMASIAGITVLTGWYLFWHFGGFIPDVVRTRAGIVYGIGGIAGTLAAIIGGSVVGRSSKKAVEMMSRAASMAESAEKRTLLQNVERLGRRMATFGLFVVLLQILAAATMAVGHYV